MTREDIEEAAVCAICENYGCNGKYPCTERDYCKYGTGKNTAFDCNECGADEFNEGFIAGANWRVNSVWHDASEKPEKKFALVEYSHFPKGNGYLVVPDPREVLESITRYAYIEDLIPTEE